MNRVVVVGSINIDLVVRGGSLPKPGETLTMDSFDEVFGGKGGNQAAAAASLGAEVHFVGAVGADARGAASREDLARLGVQIEYLVDVPAPTGVAVIAVDAEGENFIAVVPGANAAVTTQQVSEALEVLVDRDTVVVACLEIPLAAVESAAESTVRHGGRFVLNPAPASEIPDSLVAQSFVITPNAGEAVRLGGARRLVDAGAGSVVVTRGGDGVDLVSAASSVHIPSTRAAVTDTTGAGDAFTAGLAVALSRGESLNGAVQYALVAGAIATEGLGARGTLPTDAAVKARMTTSQHART